MKEQFGLYLIATDPIAGYAALAHAAVECKVRYLQLRMKGTPHETILDMARLYRKITQGTQTRFIVNDDLSIAMQAEADGVHLGQNDLSLAEARSRWNTCGKLIGLSTHSLDQAQQAMDHSPDYIGIGPVYPTATKVNADPVLGPQEAGRIARLTPIPSVAIGGINTGNLPDLLNAGVANFCVVGAVNNHPDPAAAIRALQNIWENHAF